MDNLELTPHQMKAALVESYRENSRRMGLDVPQSDLDTIATSDLSLMDMAKRFSRSATSKRAAPVQRENRAAKFARDRGLSFIKTEAQNIKERPVDAVLGMTPQAGSLKFNAIMKRIFRIMHMHVAPKGGALKAMDGTDHPELAKDAFREFLNYKFCKTQTYKNPYLDVPAQDAARMFLRRLEDICDRSTGAFGPWWVK